MPSTTNRNLSLDDSVFDQLLAERIVFLGGDVDTELANRITAQLLLLAADDPTEDITLYINSPGGGVLDGMAIYDTMQLIEPDVATWGMGMCASMGQFLLSSGTPGKRYALANSRIMMHQPHSGVGGTAADIKIQAEIFSKLKHEVALLTSEQSGQSLEKVLADGDRDRWFTAQESLDYGFIDHVVSRAQDVPGGVAPSE
jgi:ATP-dependent Clp protease protease subunit